MGFWKSLRDRAMEGKGAHRAKNDPSPARQPQPVPPLPTFIDQDLGAVIPSNLSADHNVLSPTRPPKKISTTSGSSYSKQYISSPDAIKHGSGWVVPGVGTFGHRAVYTFDQNTLPEGLLVATHQVCGTAGSSCRRCFKLENVYLENGLLCLKVPGKQMAGADLDGIQCAEVVTVEDKILYASVRTIAMFSDVPGTCHGLFFYRSDNQEVDIEYLTDPNSLSNPEDMAPVIHYVNQSLTLGRDPSLTSVDAPADVTSCHEYRIDWYADKTMFYTDGQLRATLDSDVPTQPGHWVWNNWCNGDRGWSCGPPLQDSVMKIQKITMYYDTAGN